MPHPIIIKLQISVAWLLLNTFRFCVVSGLDR